LLFNFRIRLNLEFTIKKVKGNKEGLKLNWTHQFLVFADDVNLLDSNIDFSKKNRKAPLDASKEGSKEVGL
jgi:hypothetical protein